MIVDEEKLSEIARLLDEATNQAFERGACGKFSEGAISLHLGDTEDRAEEPLRVRSVEIYSYLLGPHRSHEFGSLDDALEEVRIWHRDAMTREGW